MTERNYILPAELKEKIFSAVKDSHKELKAEIEGMKLIQSWSDKKKWKMDFTKSLLLWVILVITTLIFLNKIDDRRNNKRYLFQKGTELKLNLLNNYKQTSEKYLYTASDIYYREDTSRTTYKLFMSSIYDGMISDLKGLKENFQKNHELSLIDSFKTSVDDLFKGYIRPLIYKEYYPRAGDEVPAGHRNDFSGDILQASEYRTRLSKTLMESLLGSE